MNGKVIVPSTCTCGRIPVVLIVMLHKVVLTFQSVDEILRCDHSNESYRGVLSLIFLLCIVLSCGVAYYMYAVQGGSNFQVCG